MINIQEVIKNPDNTINLIIQQDTRTIRLHSSRPKTEADKIFTQLTPNASIYFLGGLGGGYLLEKILQDYHNSTCLIYEPISPIFDKILELRPELKFLLERKQVILVRDILSLQQLLKQHKWKEFAFMIHRPYGELFTEELSLAKKSIESHIRKHEVGNATLLRFGKVWTKNILRNMHRYFSSEKLTTYVQEGKDKAAIIIGAGPSLEEAIPYLQKHHDNAYYIACDTALPILQQANIYPDFVVTVDPQEKNSLYLRYTSSKNHKLIADPSVHDSTFEGYDSSQIILMDSIFPFYFPFKHFWGSCGLLASGGSVSTSAFDFARKMTCDPIIMVGQDLSFTQRKTHSSGNVLYEFSRVKYHRLNPFHTIQAKTTHVSHTQQIKGRIANTTVSADTRFILFKDWFSEEIPKTSAKVIIAGLEGAYLEGCYHVSVEEAFSVLRFPIFKRQVPQEYVLDKEPYKKFLDNIFIIINQLIPVCSASFLIVKKAQISNNLPLALQETNKLQKLLELPQNKNISSLISITIQDSIQPILNMPENISPQEQIQLLIHVYEDILEGLKYLQKYVHKAQRFIIY